MTPKRRSIYLRTCGYNETADCIDKMIAVLEELACRNTLCNDSTDLDWLIDDVKDALK